MFDAYGFTPQSTVTPSSMLGGSHNQILIFDLPIDSLLTRYASVTAPASKGQVPRRRLRSQTFGLSIDALLTATRIERCLFRRADDLPGAAYVGPIQIAALPHSHRSMRSAIRYRNAVFNPSGSRRVPR